MEFEKGFILAIEAIVEELETSLGKERAKDIIYRAGYKAGKKLGKKVGNTTPENAVNTILQKISPFYKVKIADIIKKDNEIEFAVQVLECSFRKILEKRGYKNPAVICRFIIGYIEGALKAMTGMEARHRVYTSTISNMCVGSITLKLKRVIE